MEYILRVYLWWSTFRGCTFGGVPLEDVPVVKFMYLVFTRMLGESFHRQFRSLLLCLSDIFQALINPFLLLILPARQHLLDGPWP